MNVDTLREQLTKLTFCMKLQSMLQEDAHTDDLEGITEQMYSAVQVAATDPLPKICKPNSPWISSETLCIEDKKREAKVARLQSQTAMQKYRSLCNEVRKAAQKDKKLANAKMSGH